jgi:hypothetical protein
MTELRVPTIVLIADVECADGRRFRGRIFIPAASPLHAGPTRPEEWLNDAALFFPFLPDDAPQPVLLNKRELLVVSVDAQADAGDIPEGSDSPVKRVLVEAEARRLEGELVIDMPQTQLRVLDYLNRAEPFLTVRDGDVHHLVQKKRITRVIEIRED